LKDYWTKELEKAHREEREWRKQGDKIVKRFNDERDEGIEDKHKFNILWSTTETLRPALISAVPRPEIRQRYKKDDPVARFGAKILERAIEFSLDTYDFIKYGKQVTNDMLLPGRGVTRLKYVPTFEKKKERIPLNMVEDSGEFLFVRRDNGELVEEPDQDINGYFMEEEREELVYEEVRAERIPWKWFRMQPADCWENVNWVAFGAPYSKDEGLNEFGKAFEKVNVGKSKTDELSKKDQNSEALKDKIIVWEIWDKRSRKQIFRAEEHDFNLEENKDPLQLEHFFPMPEPVYAVENNDTMVPTPEFSLWQDQADELDEITNRIAKVTQAIRARGAYAGEKKHELDQILTAADNELVSVEDWMAFIDKGGLDGLISWVPIEQFAKVLQILEQQRAIKIQEIFELTGVSDIQRGATDPRETARAQQLKANLGSRRLLTKQQTVQNHFRDLYRLKAEIIAEQFDPQTLQMMVGLERDDNQAFQAAVKLIKNDALRIFNIDIETDSTIAADEEKEKQGLAEAMQAIASYVGAIGPLVQQGMLPQQVAMGILSDYLRKFRFGRKLDDLLEEVAKQQPPPSPEQQQQQAEQQKAEAEQQMEAQKMQMELQMEQQKAQLEAQIEQQKAQIEAQMAQMQMQLDQRSHEQEMRQDASKHVQEMAQDQEKHEQDLENQRELNSAKAEATREQGRQTPVN
jgi:hypothetical protein